MKKLIKNSLIVIIVVFAITLICNILVVKNSRGKTFDNIDDVGYCKYGLLLATSPITSTGGHNFYFDNRINAAVELFKHGRIRGIIVSGGDYTKTHENGCDEPAAIRDSLVARGVPPRKIFLDYDGVRTINSIVKAKKYGLDSVIIISQKEHNQRAIYIANHYGLKAKGFNALPSHIHESRIKNSIREYFARVKMFFEILIGRKPKFTIDPEFKEQLEYLYSSSINFAEGHEARDTIVGNFTGKGIDTIYVYTENHFPKKDEYDQYNAYYAKSNNPELPTIELWGCDDYQPMLVYEGDLDGNGKDEWGYMHTWMTSQWRTYRVYTLVGNEWRYLIDSRCQFLDTGESFRDSGFEVLEKGNRKGYVKINYMQGCVPDADCLVHDTIVPATYTKITKENQ
jgi:SanA protein